jgi:hypothetical protein
MITSDLGETVTISAVSRTYDDRGDSTETETTYSSIAVVQIMDGSEEETKEGVLEKEDIIAFFDENGSNVAQLKVGGYLTYGSKKYEIRNVITNPGHYEVWAKKV